MPTKLLYQWDSYLREFEATVVRVDGSKVYLDETAFHPRPLGGLDADTGWLVLPSGARLRVVDVTAEGREPSIEVAHIVEGGEQLEPGVRVRGVLDWDRRYAMMRLHTALHVVAAVLYEKYGARITGSHVSPEKARVDFEISVEDWRRAVEEAVEEANRIMAECKPVIVKWLPREEALRIPGVVKLADKLPPDVDVLRIVEIPGVDVQADGAPHVRNTCEVGAVEVAKLESRGRRRKRAYLRLKAEPRQ